jgi:hypothetical protein
MMYSLASSFLFVPAAGTTGEVTALFETIHQLASKLLLGLYNRQRIGPRIGPVSAPLVNRGEAVLCRESPVISNGCLAAQTMLAGQPDRYSDVNTNHGRVVSINTAILGR